MFSRAEVHAEFEALYEAEATRADAALEAYEAWYHARKHEVYELNRDPRRARGRSPARARKCKAAKQEAQTHATVAALIASRAISRRAKRAGKVKKS
jgi:hypothetical protein